MLQDALNSTFNLEVRILTKAPKGGKRFMDLAKLNSKQTLLNSVKKEPPLRQAFEELIEKFNLDIDNPTLDCIDISHHSGSNAKAGIIRLNEFGPDKKFYRAYNIPNNLAGNDPGSVSYAINKRFKKVNEIPRIILVDGGRIQLNAIIPMIQNPRILILAIEKGHQRKSLTESIYSIDGQESIKKNSTFSIY